MFNPTERTEPAEQGPDEVKIQQGAGDNHQGEVIQAGDFFNLI